MSAIIVFITFLLIILAIGIGIACWIAVRDKELPRDRVYIDNFLSQYTDGYSRGLLTNIKQGSKRSIVEYLPEDIDEEEDKRVGVKRVVVENNKIISFSKSVWSKRVTKLWLLPPTHADLPDGIKRQSAIGESLKKMITDRNKAQTKEDMYEERIKNMEDIALEIGGGRLTKSRLQEDNEAIARMKKSMMGDNKSQGFNRGLGGSSSS